MDEVKINVFVSCEELIEEKSLNRNIERDSGRLISRIVSSLHLTSDQNFFMYIQLQKELI